MVKALLSIAEALQMIYLELHVMNDAIYSLQTIADSLSDNESGGDA